MVAAECFCVSAPEDFCFARHRAAAVEGRGCRVLAGRHTPSGFSTGASLAHRHTAAHFRIMQIARRKNAPANIIGSIVTASSKAQSAQCPAVARYHPGWHT